MATFGRLVGSRCGLLGGPVVDVPVVLVEEEVVLLQELGGHRGQLGVGEGAEEEVTLERTSLTALVWQLSAFVVRLEVSVCWKFWQERATQAGAVKRT